MCGKGGGSPPVPSAASTTFNSTTQPSAFAGGLYTDFLNRANAISQTPFNPAMLGTVAPMNANQAAAGGQLFDLGMNMGKFDPAKIREIESPYIQDVVNTTQGWFNNQNAIQANDLLSQGIRAGNAFGGDRAGVAQAQLAGQQQLAQAPVISGLYQQGYTQALNEYNLLKQMGLQGAGAALGWGTMQQQQQQKEYDVAQQNAMMQSAYPFQSLNWYGSLLGGIGPLLGQTAFGSNNPPEQSGLGAGLGAASAGIGLVGAAIGAGGGGQQQPAGQKRGGIVRGLAYGGDTGDDDDRVTGSPAGLPEYRDQEKDTSPEPAPTTTRTYYETPRHERQDVSSIFGRPNIRTGQAPTHPGFPGGSGTTQPQQNSTASTITGIANLAKAAIPLITMMSDPKTKTDVQRVGKTDDGQPLYGFRYKGDPKSYPKVYGRMAIPRHRQDGGDTDDLTMTDLGVLDPRGRELSPGIAGPARGSPGANEVGLRLDPDTGRYSPVQQSSEMPNLARVRERFRPMLENNPALRAKFDANTTAEVGTRPEARDFYQALTLDRAAARGESLPYTLSRGPGTPDRFYPASTVAATRGSGQGVSPALWGGANPANYGTGNASFDPRTGRHVGFAGGPQTGSVATGSGTERAGVEGPDLAAVQRWGYRGPTQTAVGPRGPQGTYGGDPNAAIQAKMSYSEGERDKVETGTGSTGATPEERKRAAAQAGPPDARTGTGSVGQRIPGMGTQDTFAQRLAQNPFWQFGTALMAKPGIKGRELSAIGGAAQVMSAQQLKERERVLDQKPMIMEKNGKQVLVYPDGRILQTDMDAPGVAAEQRQIAREERKARREGPGVTTLDVTEPGSFGSTTTRKQNVIWDEQTQRYVPVQVGEGQGQPAPSKAVPTEEKPTQQQQPPATAPQVRQTEAQPPPDAFGPSGWARNPDTGNYHSREGEVRDPSGKVITPAGAQPQQTAVTGPPPVEDTLGFGNVGIAPVGAITNPGARTPRNDGALQNLTPDEQRIVKGIADYRIDPNKHFQGQKAQEAKRNAMNKVMEYNPDYDAKNYANQQKAYSEFGFGTAGKDLRSNRMVLEHLGDAMTATEKLGNFETLPGVLNPVTGKIAKQYNKEYQANLKEFEAAAGAASQEAAKTFRGVGSMSVQEQEAWKTVAGYEYASPIELRAALRTLTGLVAGRLNATADSYNSVVTPEQRRDGESWMTPKARETLERAKIDERNHSQQPIPASQFPFGVTKERKPQQAQ